VAANPPSSYVFQTEFAKKLSQQMSRIVDADASFPCWDLPDRAGSDLVQVEGKAVDSL
jgi:hypothetical protein